MFRMYVHNPITPISEETAKRYLKENRAYTIKELHEFEELYKKEKENEISKEEKDDNDDSR